MNDSIGVRSVREQLKPARQVSWKDKNCTEIADLLGVQSTAMSCWIQRFIRSRRVTNDLAFRFKHMVYFTPKGRDRLFRFIDSHATNASKVKRHIRKLGVCGG